MASFWAVVLFCCQICVVIGQSYPSCSTGCVSAAVSSNCNSTDTACNCQQLDQTSFLSCLASSCDCTDQQTAAATFDSNCASNGVQLTLDVACSAASSSTTASTGSAASSSASQDNASALSSTTISSPSPSTSSSAASATSSIATSSIETSSVYSAPTSATSSAPTPVVTTVTSVSNGMATSTAVVVFSSGDNTITTLITSTHWYTPTILSTLSSTSSFPSNTPSATTVSFTQGSLIHHGLDTGEKAGIGAGVGATVVAAAVFSTWLLWFCRRRRRKTSSIAESERYQSSLGPDVFAGAAMEEKRPLSELPSDTASRKQTFSWGTSAFSDSSHHRSPATEEVPSHRSVSAESDQHSPPVDPTFQRPTLGNDGFWHNAHELQGGIPTVGGSPPAPDSFEQAPYLHKVQNRPIVPPGRWRPHATR